jgi:hypothetical protein
LGESLKLLLIFFPLGMGGASCLIVYYSLEFVDLISTSSIHYLVSIIIVLQSLLFAWWMGRIYFHMMLMDELESNPPFRYFILRPEVRWYWLAFVVNALLFVPALLVFNL